MTTGTIIIQDALQQIRAHSIASPAKPASIDLGLRILNSMLAFWLSQNIRLGVSPLKVVGDNLGEPLDATNVIVANLSLWLAPHFDNSEKIVSRSLERSANRGFGHLCTLYQEVSIPAKVISSTAPLGQGNIRTFAG